MDLKNPTRTEALLANIAGHTDVPVPDMKNATRSERLLKEILDNGGGGGGGVTKEYVDSAIADAVTAIDEDISDITDAVENKVDKDPGKGLSTNDYTDADKALVQDSPITVTATASPISTANGKPRKLTVYGKSEVINGAIKSAGEGYAVVDLGTLTWEYVDGWSTFRSYSVTNAKSHSRDIILPLFVKDYIPVGYMSPEQPNHTIVLNSTYHANNALIIKDTDYTDPADFKSAMSGVILAYELADPSQGNCIAIKTDNGTGINGTMAVFTTGTPLYGVSDTVRDAMNWDGSAGEVTKKCAGVDLGTLDYWRYSTDYQVFWNYLPNNPANNSVCLCNLYTFSQTLPQPDKTIRIGTTGYFANAVAIKDTDYTDPIQFKTAMSGVMLIYELATPTTTPLTQTENDSLSALKTYSPQTVVTINDSPNYNIEAYANTANGRVVSDMQPTRSPLLTLTASGWSNNAQTVTFAHDIGKRNSIDVELTSIKAWTAAGILATAETASTITFECDTVPTADLSFRITSMEVR